MSLANPAMADEHNLEITARTGNNSITVMWTVPDSITTNAGGHWEVWYRDQAVGGGFVTPTSRLDNAAVEYSVEADPVDRSAMATIASGGDVAITPANGATYDVQVIGYDASTAGNRILVSNVVEATPLAPPDGTTAPALTATASDIGGSATLKWTYTDGDDIPATGWEYSDDAGTTWKAVPDSTGMTREYVVTGLDGGTTAVDFQVRPLNMTTPGTASASSSATVATKSVENLQAGVSSGQVRLTWNPVAAPNTHYNFDYYPTDDENNIIVSGRKEVGPSRGVEMIEDLMNGVEYTFNVYLHTAATGGETSGAARIMATPAAVVIPVEPQAESFSAASNDPGENTRYTFKFNARQTYTPGIDDIVVEFHEDFSVPSTIAESSVNIQVGTGGNVTHPVSVLVDGEEITLELGDLTHDDDNDLGMIGEGQPITIVFRPSAGIKNPTEGGDYGEIKAEGDEYRTEFNVIFKVSVDEDEGGRGDTIVVTGKGFKNGTTVNFMRMADYKDRDFANAEPLCSAQASGEDIASCEFMVTSPLFQPGANFINAVDGRSNPGTESEEFTLEPSISANPNMGSPGDSIQVQMNDFNQGAVTGVLIARRYICEMSGEANMLANPCPTGYSKWTPNESISSSGELTFRMVLPNDAPLGVQDLRVESTGGNDGVNITIAGPRVTSNPLTVIANQRLSLTGTGFTSNSRISRLTFAGDEIESWADNTGPSVDNGGNWSLSVDLPITASTTSAGDHRILVEDQDGRTGAVTVTVPERSVSITPDTGRVGTIAVVRGVNFPSKNDEGSSFSLSIVYEAQNGRTTTSAIPDASGKFETQLRIPTTAAIPSTNLVTVSLDATVGTMAPVQVNHNVPEGIISLSETSGGPGSVITISGEGFKSFVPITQVTVGNLEVTPSPKPSTDVNGMLNFTVTIPGLDTGIQTIEVHVSGTTAGTGFTVTESGVNPGDITPVADAFEPLGDNLVSVWHFNNDTKVWSFYDPTLAEGNTLTHTITGETYLIRVKTSAEVILNRDTRSLTCVGDNCWNQVVW